VHRTSRFTASLLHFRRSGAVAPSCLDGKFLAKSRVSSDSCGTHWNTRWSVWKLYGEVAWGTCGTHGTHSEHIWNTCSKSQACHANYDRQASVEHSGTQWNTRRNTWKLYGESEIHTDLIILLLKRCEWRARPFLDPFRILRGGGGERATRVPFTSRRAPYLFTIRPCWSINRPPWANLDFCQPLI